MIAYAWFQFIVLSLMRPYLRNSKMDRGKAFLFDLANPKPGRDLGWRRFGVRKCRMRCGAWILCDLQHSADRRVFFTGEYDRLVTRFLTQLLNDKWTFIDVGANVGKYTIVAAATGARVLSIEPNARSIATLQQNIEMNQMVNVEVLSCAVSDEEGSATLFQAGDNIGGASLLTKATEREVVQQSVTIVRGDSLDCVNGGPVYIKIDVEGFEEKAVRSFSALLESAGVVLQIEITDRWLQRAGGSAASLFGFLENAGFYPYVIESESGFRRKPRLQRIDGHLGDRQYDAVFLKHEGVDQFGDWVNGL